MLGSRRRGNLYDMIRWFGIGVIERILLVEIGLDVLWCGVEWR